MNSTQSLGLDRTSARPRFATSVSFATTLLLATIGTSGCARTLHPAPLALRSRDEAPTVLQSSAPSALGFGRELEEALEESAKVRPFNGVVLVAFGDQVTARYAGYSDGARTQRIARQSSFVLGSLSKQITAALVLREVEAGRLRLDEPLVRYLPLELPETVRVRQLLNHTSGVKAVDQPLAHEPGTTFEYSNLGYDLLGRLVEHASGQSFSEAVERLFAACGILGAGTLNSNNESSLAVGFGETAEGELVPLPLAPEVKEHAASGGLIASAGEVLKWTRCLFSARAVSRSSLEMMATASTTRTHRWGVLGYGLGLQRLEADGLSELSHSGYVPGFVSTFLYYPKRCTTVVILENVATPVSDVPRAFAPHDAIRKRVRQALLDSKANGLKCAGRSL